jgi:undecaprenyl-diphosphatase
MSFMEALILGLVQGLTEFLPVSSSGHLVLTQKYMGVEDKGVTFEVLVHFGTLLSVVIYFWRPLWNLLLAILPPFRRDEGTRERRMILYLAIASVPAGIVGFSPLKGVFERAYERPAVVGLLLMLPGAILFLPRLFGRSGTNREGRDIGFKSAVIMGIGQAFAILPGISRSGSTIVSGMLSGAKSAAAAEFSFLMAIPAIAAATMLEARKLSGIETELLGAYLAGAVVAFLSGLAAIYTVLAAIRRGKFEYFGVYCLIAGAFSFFYFRSIGA